MSDFSVSFPVREIAAEVCKILFDELPSLKQQPEEQLIAASVACKIFAPAISRKTLNNWTKEGLIKAYRIASRVYYKRSEVIASTKELKKYRRS
jgi:hypothetical protein